ncbi:TPA: hypothetical protein QDB13_001536 [Burkholderia vietnamiensis]|nr:hypothetical protein [Burkholderia vietnamiensis]
MTAHFNEIDRLTSRFFVKIPALRRIAERIRRRLRLSWSRSAQRAARRAVAFNRESIESTRRAALELAHLSRI